MSTKKVIIIGGGGHAKVLIDSILSTDFYQIEGILDGQFRAGRKILGFSVLGGDEFLSKFKHAKNNFLLALGIGSIKADGKRKMIYEKYKKFGFRFPVIIHKNAYVSKSAKLQDGLQVMVRAVINPGAEIGENTIINTGAIVEHDCKVAAHCHISLNAILAGDVIVGECSHIGMGAKVLQGIKIGNRVTVGAGAVVTEDIKNGKTVIGIPAREIDE